MVDENCDRPSCRAINLNAATFQLNLPCCQDDKNQEYIAIIIPQGTRPKNNKGTESTGRAPESKNCQDIGCQYEPKSNVDDRWKTEYRCTIDDCGQRVMKSHMKTKRSPIYPSCEHQLAPLLPDVSTSDKPIFNGQGRLRSQRLPPTKMLSTTVRPQLNSAPKTCEIMARVPPSPVTATRKVPMPEQPLPSSAHRAPEIEPHFQNKINENQAGQRPLPRCFVAKEPNTTIKPTTPPPPISRTTHRPLPRCYQ